MVVIERVERGGLIIYRIYGWDVIIIEVEGTQYECLIVWEL